jgi:hypothetical protein
VPRAHLGVSELRQLEAENAQLKKLAVTHLQDRRAGSSTQAIPVARATNSMPP